MSHEEELVPVTVKGLMLDPSSNVPIIILRDSAGDELLPIWIGVFEANAIALKLEGVDAPRPMTHDLFASTLEKMKAVIERIVISDLEDSTFFARIELELGGKHISVDSRPSDAIALAVRVEAPIFVAPIVFKKAKDSNFKGKVSDEDSLKKWFEEVDPNDLGKYTM